MRTAIFVYQTTPFEIRTHESELQLCRMGAGTVPLSEGESKTTLEPGIYKIVSNLECCVTGSPSACEIIVTPNNKDNVPTVPPSRAASTFGPLDISALQAFFSVPDAQDIANP